MYHGIINVYKEPGYTSHDVVARLRGILRQKKIGHTGTLDPAAKGVLPVCLGNGTRLCDMLTDRSKTYEAVLLLGQTTDTQDTTGTVLTEDHEKALELDEVKLDFDDSALEAIAEKAMEKDTGARALRAIIEEFMLDIMYEIPKDDNIGEVTITRAYIEGTGGPVIRLRGQEVPALNG